MLQILQLRVINPIGATKVPDKLSKMRTKCVPNAMGKLFFFFIYIKQ